jgi:putative lipoic acid-binding regulatory protein
MPMPGDGSASLIEYPSQFPIKVMGARAEGFVEAIVAVARRHDPAFEESNVELRPSRAGNYLGITITVTAISRDQLDALYAELSSHPLVKVVL